MGVLLKDMGKVVTASYAHNVDAATVAGAEISRRLDDKEVTTFTLGCAPRPPTALASCPGPGRLRPQAASVECSVAGAPRHVSSGARACLWFKGISPGVAGLAMLLFGLPTR